jgi:hypothetical protein
MKGNNGSSALHQVRPAIARKILDVSESTWERWSRGGVGPKCVYLPSGAKRYRLCDLEAFVAEHTKAHSADQPTNHEHHV